MQLAPGWEALRVLGDPIVLAVAGTLFFIEFIADKIPWLDSAWDAVHTVIRPIGGALLAIRVFGDLNPAAEVVALLLLGGVSLAAHGAKASLRLTANASPEPFSNWLLSFTENGLVVGIVWLALGHPILALVVGVAGFALAVTLVVWLGRRAVLAFRGFRARARARFPAGPGRLG